MSFALKTLSISLLAIISSCAQLKDDFFLPQSWSQETITQEFQHKVFTKPSAHPSNRLHVYIEGDGWPFINRIQVNADPTPSYPLSMRLMNLDTAPAINLGRPCYFQHLVTQPEPACSPELWTSMRYSAKVVTDMVASLRFYLQAHPYKQVTLIGYSGGGTIALLMAQQMPEVDQLVTVAGNLDTEAWLKYHHYSAMKASLNPAKTIKTVQPKHQLHLTGAKDKNIPAQLAQDFLAQLGLNYWVFKDADHSCCWENYWPQVLDSMQAQVKDKLSE